MKKFFKWHKSLCEKVMEEMGISWYALCWISFLKGLIFGIAIILII